MNRSPNSPSENPHQQLASAVIDWSQEPINNKVNPAFANASQSDALEAAAAQDNIGKEEIVELTAGANQPGGVRIKYVEAADQELYAVVIDSKPGDPIQFRVCHLVEEGQRTTQVRLTRRQMAEISRPTDDDDSEAPTEQMVVEPGLFNRPKRIEDIRTSPELSKIESQLAELWKTAGSSVINPKLPIRPLGKPLKIKDRELGESLKKLAEAQGFTDKELRDQAARTSKPVGAFQYKGVVYSAYFTHMGKLTGLSVSVRAPEKSKLKDFATKRRSLLQWVLAGAVAAGGAFAAGHHLGGDKPKPTENKIIDLPDASTSDAAPGKPGVVDLPEE